MGRAERAGAPRARRALNPVRLRRAAQLATLWILVPACGVDTANIGNSGGDAGRAQGGSSSFAGGAGGSAGVTPGLGGAAARGGATSGGATSGGATSGGATSGGATSGGAPSHGGAVSHGGSGQGGGGSGCACPGEPIRFGMDGGLDASPTIATLDCASFRRDTRDYEGGELKSCELPNTGCYRNWKPELDAVLALLDDSDVQQALAAAPVVYGRDLRPVDGQVFRIDVGGKFIDVGRACDTPDPMCVTPTIPTGVQALADALKRLEHHAALDCAPECLPTPAAAASEPCAEERYYWMYGMCEKASGRACADGYETESACRAAHRQCQGLFTQPCGDSAESKCDDSDEYCGFERSACGTTDGGGVCLPKPRECPDSALTVCGCDGQTYANRCEAAQAGTSVAKVAPCE